MAENADPFSEDLPEYTEEELKAMTFTPEEQRILCQIPCEVRIWECNRLWNYEQMMFHQIKAKGKQVTQKDVNYTHWKFFRKYDHHYKKQLELEERYKAVRNNRHLLFILHATAFLGDQQKFDEVDESLEESSPSLQLDYTLSESEISTGAIPSVSLESATRARLEALPLRVEKVETLAPRVENVKRPPPRVEDAKTLPSSIENINSDDDLDDFVHNVAPGMEIQSEPIVEASLVVDSQPNTQLSSYSQFQRGVTIISTQQP